MNNNKIIIILTALVLIIPILTTQTALVQAKSKSNIFSDIGAAASAGKKAGIAAFNAGLPNKCTVGLIYCHEFNAGYREAEDVAP